MDQAFRSRIVEWTKRDPDPLTRAKTERWLEEDDDAALAEHFGKRLQFGTAGLRAELGPGPNRMNQAMVRWVTAGLAAYVAENVPNATSRGAVIAWDARRGSRVFAEQTALMFAEAGFRVWMFDREMPTPVLSYAVSALHASVGVVITASHNPPKDNGYKVYWETGAQIIEPHDDGISAAIDAVEPVVVPSRSFQAAWGDTILEAPEHLVDDYVRDVLALRVNREAGVRVVYSAMHGVGAELVLRVLREAGHVDVFAVPEQVEPDGEFPTVAFPNPEEPGAMDLSMALGDRVGADVLIANDPDADRLAVVIPVSGGWRQLTGNEVGLLLADDLLSRYSDDKRPLVATTIVSSSMLHKLALQYDAEYAETLTGFKWIANKALEHDAEGGQFVIGFEEALGYSVGSLVRDKDGISAALLLVDLVAACKAAGETLVDRLNALAVAHGLYVSGQRSVVMPGDDGAARIKAIMSALRADPPTRIGGRDVVRATDILTGDGFDHGTGETWKVLLPASNVLAYNLDGGVRVLARPSGTEPKIKFYFEVAEPVGADGVEGARARAEAFMKRAETDLLEKIGL